MDASNRDFIADVMSGDDDPNCSSHSSQNDDDTVVGTDDVTLSTLLSESERLIRNASNMSMYKTSPMNGENFERRTWQSLHSLRPSQGAVLPPNMKSKGTSDYVSDDLLLPSSSRSYQKDLHLYSNRNQVQTFSDTASLLQTLKDELVSRTTEMHRTENEYFNLKASFENLKIRFDNSHGELSNLRSQIHTKDKQIRQLSEKVTNLTAEISLSREDGKVAKSELEKVRIKLDQSGTHSDLQNESLSKELKVREEVIAQLRSEITETTRSNRTAKVTEHTEGQLKERLSQCENSVKLKDQKINLQLKQIKELEQEVERLNEAIVHSGNTKLKIGQLEEEVELLKEQLEHSKIKNGSINDTLSNSKRFYEDFKETSEKSINEYARMTQKLKSDYRELEEKHRDSLGSLKQRGDNNKRLSEDVKELTEKLKSMATSVTENDKRTHNLELEKVEYQQKIESLKAQLVESSISETNTKTSNKKDCENMQDYIAKLSQETVQLNRSEEELREKVRIRESTIGQLNSKVVELENSRVCDHKLIKDLEEKIYQSKHRERMLEEIDREKENKIEVLEAGCKEARDHNEASLEEVHKILSEKRELERSLQRKEEKIAEEINERSYETENLKLEVKKLTQLVTIERESSQLSIGELENLLKEHNKLNFKFKDLSEELENKDLIAKEMCVKEEHLRGHNIYLEEELTKMKLALEDSSEEVEQIKKSWDTREDTLGICKEELSRQSANNRELICKIEQRDELLQKLTNETAKLKQKYQDKSSELAKWSDQNKRLTESCRELEVSLSALNGKHEDMIIKKDKEINQIKREAEDIQGQYTLCYDELMQKEEHINKYQLIEKESSSKLTKLQEEMSQQLMDNDEMEAELNVIRAKHRACQEELFHRDEELLDLKTGMQNYQQDISAFQNERPAFQREIDRWSDKYSDLEQKCQRQQNELENMEDSGNEKEHRIDELMGELQIVKQENMNHLRSIDQLKMDLGLSKSTNGDRYNHFQSIIESLKTETETKTQESRLLEDNCAKYRNEINRLKSEQEDMNQSYLLSNEDVEQLKEKLRNKDEECQHWIHQTQSAQYLNEEVKISLDALEKEITQVKQQLDIKEGKLRTQADALTKLKNDKNQCYKNLMDCQRQLDATSRDKNDYEKTIEDNSIKLKKYEQCIRDLNEELAAAQVEMSSHSNKVCRLETELNQTCMMTSHKNATIETLECKIAKLKSNIGGYKSCHKTEDAEVEHLNCMLMQQSKKCAELEDILSCLNREKNVMSEERAKREMEISELKESFIVMKNDVENLRRERDEKCYRLDDVQKKYQHEIKKVKTYSKEVEEDIALLHSTIDEMQKVIESSDNNLKKSNERNHLLEETLDQRKQDMSHLEQNLRELVMENKYKESLSCSGLNKQDALQKEIDHLMQEIKESRSIMMDLANQKTMFETKASSLEIALDKSDKKLSQSEMELKKMQATFFSYSKELEELRQEHQDQARVLERTKNQYGKFSEEYSVLKEEKLHDKKKCSMISSEMESLKAQMMHQMENCSMLKEQVEQQEDVIIELQRELLQERSKVVDLQNNEFQKRKAINEMENETDVLSRTRQDLKMKLREKERLASTRQNENEKLNSKIKQMTEALMDKDNKVRVLDRRLKLVEEENCQLRNTEQGDTGASPRQMTSDRSEYTAQLESRLGVAQAQLEHLQSQIRGSNNKICDLSIDKQMKEEEILRVKQEKALLQTRMASLTLNTEDSYSSINRKTQLLEDENESLQRIVKTLRYELEEKDQLLLRNHDDSIRSLSSKLGHIQDQDLEHDAKLRQLRNDLESRNKEVLDLREVIDLVRNENASMVSELGRTEETIASLKSQNASIVDNFNVWVQEQKAANERLGDKIREQNKTIHDLRREKETSLRETCGTFQRQKSDKDSVSSVSSFEEEKMILQNQIRSTEENCEKMIQGKNKIIEELHMKISGQITELTKLKQDILLKQNEQQNAKIDLERALASADASKTMNCRQCQRLSSSRTRLGSATNISDKERSGQSGDDPKDKQYWIQRVGELSDELQQCREYWSNKFKALSNNVESSASSEGTLTPVTTPIS